MSHNDKVRSTIYSPAKVKERKCYHQYVHVNLTIELGCIKTCFISEF